MPSFPTGCLYDPDRTAAVREAMKTAGIPGTFYQASGPDLKGAWREYVRKGGTMINCHDAERKLLKGKIRKPDFQNRGTCAARAQFRTKMLSLACSIVFRAMVARYVEISYEFDYAVARNIIRQGSMGRAYPGSSNDASLDGAYVVDIAKVGQDYGWLERGVYGGIDLRTSNEAAAIDLSQPKAPIPKEMFEAASPYRTRIMQCESGLEMADALACYHPLNYGSQMYSDPNAQLRNGMLDLVLHRGGHAECRSAIILLRPVKDVDDDDELIDATALQTDGSWGNWPLGTRMLKYAGGTYEVPPGSRVSSLKQHIQGLKYGECWTSQVTSAPRPESLTDMHTPGKEKTA